MKIETKYYLKPSTILALQQFPPSTHIQQYLFITKRCKGSSNYRVEWNMEYFRALRNKFLFLGYPIKLTNETFIRAVHVD